MRANWKAAGGMSTLGLEIVVAILFGFLGGRWLDERYATDPWFTAIGALFGLGAAVRFLYRASKRAEKALEKDDFQESSVGRSARYALNEKRRRWR
jgi:ATP synthase protein I